MSFFFQPPIFAVQPTTYIQPVVWIPSPQAVPSYTVVQPVTAPTMLYTPPVLPVYTIPVPVPIPSVSAPALPLPAAQNAHLRIRLVYYGHRVHEADVAGGRSRADARVWVRAADAQVVDYPGAPQHLREEITAWARRLRVGGSWRSARIHITRPGSLGPRIDADVGPVADEGTLRVMELCRDGDRDRDGDGELEGVLEVVTAGQGVVVTVCMDDVVDEGRAGSVALEVGETSGQGDEVDGTEEGQVQDPTETSPSPLPGGEQGDEQQHTRELQDQGMAVPNGV